jgi:hypothetical protein
MAKVTQQDVVNFLKEKVAQLTSELESAQNALNALQGSASAEAAVSRGRKLKAVATAPKMPAAKAKRKTTAKPGGAKRGRKPKLKETPAPTPGGQSAEQE